MARSYQLSAFGTQVPYRELYKIIVSATYTLVPDDNNKILIFSLGANATVNLPAAAAVEGMTFKIWNGNSGAFTVTIDPQGAEQIDGAATLVLDPGEGARCYAFAGGLPTSTGARWITDRINAADVFSTAVVAGSTKNSVVRYTGTTATAGAFNGSATTPTGTARLNYEGYFYPTFINLIGSADTATAASHYFVETASDGFVRPKTLASTQAEIVTAATVYSVGVISGTATQSFVRYASTTATAGAFDGGAVAPSGTTRLNYSGNFYATNFFGSGSGLTGIPNSATTAASANGVSTIVARDAAGNFSANTITATNFVGTITSATTATNLAGGSGNTVPYQTAAGTTAFLAAPTTANTVLSWSGTSLTWAAPIDEYARTLAIIGL